MGNGAIWVLCILIFSLAYMSALICDQLVRRVPWVLFSQLMTDWELLETVRGQENGRLI